jgi:glycosyltransferase involved in cell wall biosynthesis
MFSVLMSIYARERPMYFREALASLTDQSSFFKEVVLVEDGPIGPDLKAVIKDFGGVLPIKSVPLRHHVGLASALNIGLAECSCEWIFRFDTDDVCAPCRAALQWAEINRSDVDILGGQVQECEPESMIPTGVKMVPCDEREIRHFVKRRNPFNHPSICFRKSVVSRLGGYPQLHLKEDYGLWAAAISAGARVKNVPEVLVYVRAGRDMIARRGGRNYLLSEIKLQQWLVRQKLKSIPEAMLDGTLRTVIFASPRFVRQFVYSSFLRA